MKTAFKLTTAILAAGVVFAACTKDATAGKEDVNPQEGFRTIKISFDTSTKSALDNDGKTPKFVNGDIIMVSDGKQCKPTDVNVKDGIASFTTDLTGALKAVHPYSAAKTSGGDIVGVTVSTHQSGTFKDANIAMAEIGATQNTAIFKNQTAVLGFYVGSGIGVTKIEISEMNGLNIASTGSETENCAIMVTPLAGHSSTFEDALEDRICYVAILPTTAGSGDQGGKPLRGNDYCLEVKSYTKTSQIETKAAPNGSIVTKEFQNVSLPAGTLANVFIPYYIPVNVGTDEKPYFQNWAYCNIGAFLPEELGYCFTWGNVEGYQQNFKGDWINVSSREVLENGFTPENYTKFGYGHSLTGDIQLYHPRHDAASAAWPNSVAVLAGLKSEGWRMPTKAEVDTLLNRFPLDAGRTFGTDSYYSGKRGVKFTDAADNQVFFAKALYWTASYGDAERAYVFDVSETGQSTRLGDRYLGYPIRPIFGDPHVESTENTGLRIEPIDKGDETL